MFSVKSIVQCSDELDHKIDLKLRKKSTADQSYVIINHSSTHRLYLFCLLPTKKDPLDVQSGRLINKSLGFLTNILDMFNPVSRPIRGLISRPD